MAFPQHRSGGVSSSPGRGQADRQPMRIGFAGSYLAYWPVLVGASVAVILVVAGLTVAVQVIKRPSPVPRAQQLAAISEEPAPVVEKIRPLALASRPAVGTPPKVPIAVVAVRLGPAVKKPGLKVPIVVPKSPPASEQAAGTLKPEQVAAQVEEAAVGAPILTPQPPPVAVVATAPAGGTCGTCINFLPTPQAASRRAKLEDKLVFLLHVSGNFEDPQFT